MRDQVVRNDGTFGLALSRCVCVRVTLRARVTRAQLQSWLLGPPGPLASLNSRGKCLGKARLF